MNDITIITTPGQLTEAFAEWMRQYEEAPETFHDSATGEYAVDCSAFLVQILKELNAKGV